MGAVATGGGSFQGGNIGAIDNLKRGLSREVPSDYNDGIIPHILLLLEAVVWMFSGSSRLYSCLAVRAL